MFPFHSKNAVVVGVQMARAVVLEAEDEDEEETTEGAEGAEGASSEAKTSEEKKTDA